MSVEDNAHPVTPEEVAAIQSMQNIVSVVKTAMRYALNNIHYLVFDDQGRVVWPEVANELVQMVGDQDLTDEGYQIAIIMALENHIREKKYDDLDAALKKLPLALRLLFSTAEGSARAYLSLHPELRQELAKNWDALFLNIVEKDPEFAYLRDALENAPNIRAWLQGYVLRKLKISPEEYSHAGSQNAPSAGQESAGKGVPSGSQDQGRPGEVSGAQPSEGPSRPPRRFYHSLRGLPERHPAGLRLRPYARLSGLRDHGRKEAQKMSAQTPPEWYDFSLHRYSAVNSPPMSEEAAWDEFKRHFVGEKDKEENLLNADDYRGLFYNLWYYIKDTSEADQKESMNLFANFIIGAMRSMGRKYPLDQWIKAYHGVWAKYHEEAQKYSIDIGRVWWEVVVDNFIDLGIKPDPEETASIVDRKLGMMIEDAKQIGSGKIGPPPFYLLKFEIDQKDFMDAVKRLELVEPYASLVTNPDGTITLWNISRGDNNAMLINYRPISLERGEGWTDLKGGKGSVVDLSVDYIGSSRIGSWKGRVTVYITFNHIIFLRTDGYEERMTFSSSTPPDTVLRELEQLKAVLNSPAKGEVLDMDGEELMGLLKNAAEVKADLVIVDIGKDSMVLTAGDYVKELGRYPVTVKTKLSDGNAVAAFDMKPLLEGGASLADLKAKGPTSIKLTDVSGIAFMAITFSVSGSFTETYFQRAGEAPEWYKPGAITPSSGYLLKFEADARDFADALGKAAMAEYYVWLGTFSEHDQVIMWNAGNSGHYAALIRYDTAGLERGPGWVDTAIEVGSVVSFDAMTAVRALSKWKKGTKMTVYVTQKEITFVGGNKRVNYELREVGEEAKKTASRYYDAIFSITRRKDVATVYEADAKDVASLLKSLKSIETNEPVVVEIRRDSLTVLAQTKEEEGEKGIAKETIKVDAGVEKGDMAYGAYALYNLIHFEPEGTVSMNMKEPLKEQAGGAGPLVISFGTKGKANSMYEVYVVASTDLPEWYSAEVKEGKAEEVAPPRPQPQPQPQPQSQPPSPPQPQSQPPPPAAPSEPYDEAFATFCEELARYNVDCTTYRKEFDIMWKPLQNEKKSTQISMITALADIITSLGNVSDVMNKLGSYLDLYVSLLKRFRSANPELSEEDARAEFSEIWHDAIRKLRYIDFMSVTLANVRQYVLAEMEKMAPAVKANPKGLTKDQAWDMFAAEVQAGEVVGDEEAMGAFEALWQRIANLPKDEQERLIHETADRLRENVMKEGAQQIKEAEEEEKGLPPPPPSTASAPAPSMTRDAAWEYFKTLIEGTGVTEEDAREEFNAEWINIANLPEDAQLKTLRGLAEDLVNRLSAAPPPAPAPAPVPAPAEETELEEAAAQAAAERYVILHGADGYPQIAMELEDKMRAMGKRVMDAGLKEGSLPEYLAGDLMSDAATRSSLLQMGVYQGRGAIAPHIWYAALLVLQPDQKDKLKLWEVGRDGKRHTVTFNVNGEVLTPIDLVYYTAIYGVLRALGLDASQFAPYYNFLSNLIR